MFKIIAPLRMCVNYSSLPTGSFSFIYSLYIPMYVFFCRSECFCLGCFCLGISAYCLGFLLGCFCGFLRISACSRSCEKTLTYVNENRNRNRKLNSPVCRDTILKSTIVASTLSPSHPLFDPSTSIMDPALRSHTIQEYATPHALEVAR